MTRTVLICLFTATSSGALLLPSPARAQATPATPPPTQTAAAPAATAAEPPIGENYKFEVSAGVWPTMPSTMLYSDTESVTLSGATTATTVTGTNIDFKQQLGLSNQMFPAFHLVIRPMPKHKIHLDFVPLYYKQSATLTTALNFNGQSYLAGQAVSSSLYWNSWQLAYEFDPLTFDRGYIGGMVAVNYYDIRGELSNGTQSGGAGVHIPMPGLGVIGRYYVAPRVSVTGSLTGYDLPGGATSTHGHVIDIEGYATINVSKYAGLQAGYRSFDASHVWGSPLNTGSFTIRGPFIGGTFRY